MLISYKRGQGSVVLRVKLLNSSVTTGAGLTGLTFNSAGLIISTIADNEATATAYTQAGGLIETIAALGTYAAPTATKCRFKEVDATNHAGVYEIQLADARLAVASAKSLVVSVSGATNCAETDATVPLRDLDPYDAVRAGLTSLPNANADAAGGLPISDAGGLDLDNLVVDGLKAAGVVLSTSTIETVTDQTHLIIPATADATDDNAYNGCLAVVIDGTDPNQRSTMLVSDYVSGTRTVVLATAPVFTVTTSDTLVILSLATAASTWDEILTGATHNIASSAGRRLRGVQAFGDYANGSLWFDSVNGVGGQVAYENATVQNPSNSLTDVLAIASALNMVRIEVAPGSTLTLDASVEGFTVVGENWTLALASQSISGSYFHGADVSGIGTGATKPRFDNCHFGNTSLPSTHIARVGLEGTLTLTGAGDYFLDGCHSGVAGTSTPVIDFEDAAENKNLNLRGYSGGIEIRNIGQAGSTDKMSLEGWGQLILASTCEAATIAIRGMFTITDNVVGGFVDGAGGTLSQDARYDVGQINAQADAAIETYKLDHLVAAADDDDPVDNSIIAKLASKAATADWSDFDNTTDSLEAIQDDVTTLLGRVTATLFSGMTSLAEWLGLMAGKQAADATALTEIKATGAGSGTYSEATDSQEAILDNGNSAWITATGFSTLDAAGIRSAMGLASANLDTQLGDIPTVAEFEARTLVAAAYFDPTSDTVATVTTVTTLTGHTPQTGDSYAVVSHVTYGNAAILTRGNVAWVTATGFAVAGDEMDLIDAPNATAITAIQSGLSTVTTAQVKTQVEAVFTDAQVEVSEVPAITAGYGLQINWMFTLARNRILGTAVLSTLRNAANDADLATSVVSDDDTDFVRGAWTS